MGRKKYIVPPRGIRFECDIEISNDGMRHAADVARALREIADRITSGEYQEDLTARHPHGGYQWIPTQNIKDINGNTVGGWWVKENYER